QSPRPQRRTPPRPQSPRSRRPRPSRRPRRAPTPPLSRRRPIRSPEMPGMAGRRAEGDAQRPSKRWNPGRRDGHALAAIDTGGCMTRALYAAVVGANMDQADDELGKAEEALGRAIMFLHCANRTEEAQQVQGTKLALHRWREERIGAVPAL